MHAIDEEYVTVAEAATLLRVAPSTIRRWIREGDVPAYRIDRRRVALKRDELETLITPIRPELGMNISLAGDEPKLNRRLTPEEKQYARDAMDRARRHADETQARRGGKLFSPSWEIINEMRDERTRQLS
ncbi:MAG: helix-turn-helix domain-containing protein [Chloroflexia bacterium]|nr:helix-turn-helix domain-containing protein [Chloroflexia bacterium]